MRIRTLAIAAAVLGGLAASASAQTMQDRTYRDSRPAMGYAAEPQYRPIMPQTWQERPPMQRTLPQGYVYNPNTEAAVEFQSSFDHNNTN
jgi:hypothetical protein